MALHRPAAAGHHGEHDRSLRGACATTRHLDTKQGMKFSNEIIRNESIPCISPSIIRTLRQVSYTRTINSLGSSNKTQR